MWKDPLESLNIEDCGRLYEPDEHELIEISCMGGHIGRFYWYNQGSFMIEQFNADGTLYERTIWEIPGSFAFVWSVYDFIAFLIT
jgi:hypothetical protein